jgi:hypothetical protein
MDYLVAARGYGLALGFFGAALALSVEALLPAGGGRPCRAGWDSFWEHLPGCR